METATHLPRICRTAVALISLCLLGLSACEDQPVPTNATEDARIARSMEDVAAGQARSEADVADIESARRHAAREKQSDSSRRAH
jgi:hypothetical protein